ncbi:conserved exported hypothetical protein [Xanthomonas citri pv. fuscans]|nr:conserved exported hypothetical protein [Xanthomonas citri pv. fuscans]SOO46067.1 conserved exported hypothetical protein [Xanthomonas citri pv. fuscans]
MRKFWNASLLSAPARADVRAGVSSRQAQVGEPGCGPRRGLRPVTGVVGESLLDEDQVCGANAACRRGTTTSRRVFSSASTPVVLLRFSSRLSGWSATGWGGVCCSGACAVSGASRSASARSAVEGRVTLPEICFMVEASVVNDQGRWLWRFACNTRHAAAGVSPLQPGATQRRCRLRHRHHH